MAKKYGYKSLYKDYIKEYNKGIKRLESDDELPKPQSFDNFKNNFKREIKNTKYNRLSGEKIAIKIAKEDVYYNVDYMTQYNKSLAKAGTAAETPQSLDDFKLNFNDIKDKIKENKSHRLSGKQIAQKMAREDVYERSMKQAKVIKEALERMGFEAPSSVTAMRVKKVPEEFWDLVEKEKKSALEKGKTDKEANIYISQYIFGSK